MIDESLTDPTLNDQENASLQAVNSFLEDEYSDEKNELDETDFRNDSRLTGKWIGCANHKLQLVLKILDNDSEFSSFLRAVVKVLSSIRRSSNAVRDFYDLTKRCIVLPNISR